MMTSTETTITVKPASWSFSKGLENLRYWKGRGMAKYDPATKTWTFTIDSRDLAELVKTYGSVSDALGSVYKWEVVA